MIPVVGSVVAATPGKPRASGDDPLALALRVRSST